MRARFFSLSLLALSVLAGWSAQAVHPASAQQPPVGPPPRILPPGFVEEPDEPPEDPLPPLPREFPIAPPDPAVAAPDAAELLKACKQPAFTDCFRLWQPPPPPPPEPEPEKETDTAQPTPPGPPDRNAPRDPAQGGPVPPPQADPQREAAAAAADRATFESLAKALKESGLDGKVLLTNPSGDGPTLRLDTKPNRTNPKP